MGTISITLPIDVSGTFRIKSESSAKKFVKELEQIGERVSPFDEVFGIWADRPETSKELTDRLRAKNNRRDG